MASLFLTRTLTLPPFSSFLSFSLFFFVSAITRSIGGKSGVECWKRGPKYVTWGHQAKAFQMLLLPQTTRRFIRRARVKIKSTSESFLREFLLNNALAIYVFWHMKRIKKNFQLFKNSLKLTKLRYHLWWCCRTETFFWCLEDVSETFVSFEDVSLFLREILIMRNFRYS